MTKKCKMCSKNTHILGIHDGETNESIDLLLDVANKILSLSFDRDDETVDEASVEISFCPYCGEKL